MKYKFSSTYLKGALHFVTNEFTSLNVTLTIKLFIIKPVE